MKKIMIVTYSFISIVSLIYVIVPFMFASGFGDFDLIDNLPPIFLMVTLFLGWYSIKKWAYAETNNISYLKYLWTSIGLFLIWAILVSYIFINHS